MPGRHTFLIACAGLAAWSAASCAEPDPRAAVVPEVRDSAGIRIVENARPVSAGSGRWARVAGEPTVEIGVAEGAAPYMFWRIRMALEAPSGEIVVVDGGTREIRVFDGAGRHVRTFGGKGGGPGEFGDEPVIRLVPPDTVLAWDGGRLRLTWFTLDGEFVKERSLAGTPGADASPFAMAASRWELHPDGTVVGQKSAPTGRREGLVEEPLFLVIARDELRRLRWIRDLPGLPEVNVGRTGMSAILHPTVGAGNWAVRVTPPSIVAAADPDGRWALSVYDLDGTLTGSIRIAVPRREVTEALAQTARNWLLADAEGMPPAQLRDYRTAVERIPMPDSTPAASSVVVDAGDRLWVKRWIGLWEEEDEGTDIYDVIDRSGQWLGWVEVDRNLGRILSIGHDHILFQWTGPLGVSRVRKHALHGETEAVHSSIAGATQ